MKNRAWAMQKRTYDDLTAPVKPTDQKLAIKKAELQKLCYDTKHNTSNEVRKQFILKGAMNKFKQKEK